MRRNENRGFTMIELLCTITIISCLGAIAAGQFLDFRNEGRAASVLQSLQTMRTAINLQTQQARLRCNVVDTDSWRSSGGQPFYHSLINNMFYNNITSQQGAVFEVCNVDQVPDTNSRKFLTISEQERAHAFYGIVDTGPSGYFPKNPFMDSPSDGKLTISILGTTSTYLGLYGGPCGIVAFNQSISVSPNWITNQDTGEFYAGTNTPGINECNF